MSPIKQTNGLNLQTQLTALYKQEMPQPQSSLAIAAEYHFKNPGKCFRAQLALSSGLSLGLNTVDNLHWAAACELLHNASLIHDDISDASTHRRGQESIHQHFGPDMALCLGDWMVAKAFELGALETDNSAVAFEWPYWRRRCKEPAAARYLTSPSASALKLSRVAAYCQRQDCTPFDCSHQRGGHCRWPRPRYFWLRAPYRSLWPSLPRPQ